MDGLPLGSERKSSFRNWSRKGINRVSDIWDEGRGWFKDIEEIRNQTKSRDITSIRGEIIAAIPREILP